MTILSVIIYTGKRQKIKGIFMVEDNPDIISNLNDLVNGQIHRRVTNLSVNFLKIMEEFLDDGVIKQEYFDKIRKQLLDSNGSTIRELQSMINSLEISFKK